MGILFNSGNQLIDLLRYTGGGTTHSGIGVIQTAEEIKQCDKVIIIVIVAPYTPDPVLCQKFTQCGMRCKTTAL